MIVNEKKIWPGLVQTYGEKDAAMWYYRWQIFYMAVAELFGYADGEIWGVSHYLFSKADTVASR